MFVVRYFFSQYKISFFLFLLIFLSLLSIADVSAKSRLSGNRECSICHIMWLNDFKRDDVKPLIKYDPKPVVDTGKQDVVSTKKMCFSCHDGFALDSRFLWKDKSHNHPVGVIPSDDIDIPTTEGKVIFPLNEEGKMYCGTCHSAHGVDWDEEESPIFLRIKNKDSRLCMACHLNRSTGPKEGNHPVFKQPKKIPEHLLAAGSKFTKKNEVICQSCHIIHGSEQKKLLAVKNNDSQLCANCHTDKQSIRQSKHNMKIANADLKNARDQKVSEKGPCSACHIPHKAKGPRLWARNLDAGKDLSSNYCLSCHNKNGVAHKKTINQHSHPVNKPIKKIGIIAGKNSWSSTVPSVNKNIIPLPLFDEDGHPVKEGGNVTCLTCHDPHRWSKSHGTKKDPAKPLTKKQILREGDGNNSFLRLSNGGNSGLCKNCHVDKAAVTLSKHNLGISSPKARNASGMTTRQSGACSACHVPHNGRGRVMWSRKEKGSGQGNMKLCTSCHKKNGIAGKKRIGKHSHPIHIKPGDKGLTTTLPLYDDNGKRDDANGYIDCTTCHNPHQWDPANIASTAGKKKRVEGDASNSFLRKKATGSVQLCLNCHKDKKTVIKTDHDLSVTAKKAKNARGQTVAQSGPCGQCHSVHNAQQALKLWARKPGREKNKDAMVALCTSCHRRGGAGKTKIPPYLEHPQRTVPVNKGRLRAADKLRVVPPVFSKIGKQVGAGLINCATCHDVHRWKPGSNQPGNGLNREGDVHSSFLRHSNTEYFLCTDCHGEDAIYRYKYYHWKQSRPKKRKK